MEHHQSAEGFQTLVGLLTVVIIIAFTAFYLSFIKKRKSEGGGHH
ncbi:hypothetical protein [Pedobacter sp. JY14-1]|nr:hypothetical protein [Pedobacter sp. JY14-1]